MPWELPSVSGRVKSELVYEALARLRHRTNEPPGFTVGRSVPVMSDPDLHVRSFLRPTLGDAYRVVQEAQRLVSDDLALEMHREGRHLYLYVSLEPALHPGAEELATSILTGAVAALRNLCKKDIELRSNLGGARHAAYDAVLGKVSYGGKDRFVRFDADLASERLNPTFEHLAERFEPLVRWRVARLGQEPAVSTRLVDTLRADPERCTAPVEVLAARLAMSPRTLQRRLSGEGTSLEQIRDLVAFQTALLSLSRRSCPALANSLGYSDERAFRRAFIRWSGLTPSKMREQLVLAPG